MQLETHKTSLNLLVWFVSLLFFETHLYEGANIISIGQTLSGNQTISSEDGTFELGFFTPGKSQNYYIGTWYKNSLTTTVVWVANRNHPVSDPYSSELKLLSNGNLVLLNESRKQIWSSNATATTDNSSLAILQDNGNFVIRDVQDSSNVRWQSSYDILWLPSGYTAFSCNLGKFNEFRVLVCNCIFGYKPRVSKDWALGNYADGCVELGEVKEESGEKRKVRKIRLWIVVGSLMGLFTLLGIVTLFILQLRKRKVGRYNEAGGNLMLFKYKEIRKSTKYFSEKLGEGGFGLVFKGTLPNSRAIAVKRLKNLNQGEKQFRAEVSTIGQIQHVNLVRLQGFCINGEKRLLVFDYMKNGSLENHLFREKSNVLLDWKARYKIMIGTARGLNYLHEKCRDCIIHCDIKPDNILLDDEFNAKIADFGLAKLLGREFSHVLTTIKGTRGYLAPEWILNEAITPKVDVYSYGKLLFEIISGRRNIDMLDDGDYFPALVAEKLSEGEEVLMQFLDKRLKGEANSSELDRACRVACWCIQDDKKDRPNMGNVIQILEGLSEVGIPPIPRLLLAFTKNDRSQPIFYENSTFSTTSSMC